MYTRKVESDADNLNNEKEAGTLISRELFNYFRLLHHPDFQLECKNDQPPYIIRTNNALRLTQEMNYILAHKNLLTFANSIMGLTENPEMGLDSEVFYAYTRLFKILRQEAPINAVHAIVIEHFSSLANKLTSEEPMNLDDIIKSTQDLDNKLYGRPPISRNLRLIVGGVIGALGGLALGLLIGIAATWWAGGIGAIPLALVGASKGAAFGTGIALTVGCSAAAGGFAASVFGFYGGKQSQTHHHAKTKAIHESAPNIINLAASVFTSIKDNPSIRGF